MDLSDPTGLEAPPRSAIPHLLGLLALLVLAAAFVGALMSSLRSNRWNDGLTKGQVALAELARLDAVVPRARELLSRRAELHARLRGVLPPELESSLRVTQISNLVERFGESTVPAAPECSRMPTTDELAALDSWLDDLYRRIAAGRDIENRVPDLEQELAALRTIAGEAPGRLE